ncbi:hypothetical protein HCN44_005256 [Aphidius gifuensis]|uniref:Uncharacterized protein n=1 Tax=Aphidius gifuensis TaxID=684658 RepID=A0A835CV89_APHGI|nr:hypothetical protein HCN44_005256 [Aphidius gifuensis]
MLSSLEGKKIVKVLYCFLIINPCESILKMSLSAKLLNYADSFFIQNLMLCRLYVIITSVSNRTSNDPVFLLMKFSCLIFPESCNS